MTPLPGSTPDPTPRDGSSAVNNACENHGGTASPSECVVCRDESGVVILTADEAAAIYELASEGWDYAPAWAVEKWDARARLMTAMTKLYRPEVRDAQQ